MSRRTTKGKKPKFLPIYGDMEAELQMAIAARDPNCPFLVQHKGRLVFDREKAWATACQAAGSKGALVHDMGRTAITNMVEAGLSEKEVMDISGDRTRAVFDGYHIVSVRRLKELGQQLEVSLKAKDQEVSAGRTSPVN